MSNHTAAHGGPTHHSSWTRPPLMVGLSLSSWCARLTAGGAPFSLITFLTNLAYVVTAACPPTSPAAKYLYYNGGPLDFLFATGDFLMMLAVVVLPLGRPLHSAGAVLDEPSEQPTFAPVADVASVAGEAQPATAGAVYGRLVEALEDEVRFLRHEVKAQAHELRERDSVIEALLPHAFTSGRPVVVAPAGRRGQPCENAPVCSEGTHSSGGVVAW